MPPRKKSVAADGSATVATRSSARVKAAAAVSSQDSADATAPKPKTKAKGKGKRTRESDDEDDPPVKPAAKKAKKPKSKATVEDEEDTMDVDGDDVPVKPTSKKGKKKTSTKPTSKTAVADADEKQADDEPPAKMVTVIKRGAVPVDPHSDKVDTHQVYTNSGIWDAMLNQTDISGNQNKNKFYVLQLLHPTGNNNSCILYTRWGRVGENGQSQVKGPWPGAQAIGEFKKQFKSKAAIAWEDRVGMVPKPGKYTWIERSFEDEDDQEERANTAMKSGNSKPVSKAVPKSELSSEIQDFCKLIFSTSIIDATLSSMNYDARKLPLGKLAKSTILSGFSALKKLSEVISDPTSETVRSYSSLREACEQLSSAYYSIIPHDFGRSRPTVISTTDQLKKELDLVDALGDMEIASKLIQSSINADDDGNAINPLDAQFQSLGLNYMEPLDKNGEEFKTLAKYAQDTHGATHSHIKANIQHIYRVERPGEEEAFEAKAYNNLPEGERLLLWHGSRSTNFAGILKQGLRIAPPEAPVNGYMFGKGVYFADMMSKSAGYCYSHLSDGTGVLLLCEVAAKPFYEKIDAEYDANVHCLKNNKLSTKGLGRTQPTKWKDAGKATGNDALIGCHMPDGGGEDINHAGYLQYNEYIVYDTAQIRTKYLFMVGM